MFTFTFQISHLLTHPPDTFEGQGLSHSDSLPSCTFSILPLRETNEQLLSRPILLTSSGLVCCGCCSLVWTWLEAGPGLSLRKTLESSDWQDECARPRLQADKLIVQNNEIHYLRQTSFCPPPRTPQKKTKAQRSNLREIRTTKRADWVWAQEMGPKKEGVLHLGAVKGLP